MDKKSLQSEISSYMGKLLRDNFGKGPTSIYVSIKEPFLTVYIRDFLGPMERVLINQERTDRVEEMRDLLMQELIPEIKAALWVMAEIDVQELYYDWTLENRSGMIVGVYGDRENDTEALEDYHGKEKVHREIEHVSKQAEKLPEQVDSFFLNERTLLIERNGILVAIEKELIRSGFEEKLKLAKRHLEKGLLDLSAFENILGTKVRDAFVDWDFNLDRSYFIFVVDPVTV
ncbi:hypothetical protein N781_06655 [Pontibacillus halophilus JSM 076056 = DSM 19796]|uniref:Na+-translocating membrane potential-generating system MpsC domain-containing protein n=1 Tax=Pontibacillus halophilus JSM 076056 = DSM 19796 TaxID=1385510 RepID=A0A0A5GC16_9BACI|nr:Na-translocating system protein MpsC family protein [Pontibacillus halophilus]KGX90731.1 hypothetical protein N781_06655 [Pontibacillus halophilus JSM 076056 = DSM 19796]